MQRLLVTSLVASFLAVVLAVLPTSATPAQAVVAFAPGSSLNNPANAPILVQLGIVSGGGATAATGATAAAVTTGVAGTLGFKTVVGTSVAAVGLMTLKGVEAGLFLQTDPAHSPDGPPAGWLNGVNTVTLTLGSGTATVAYSYDAGVLTTSIVHESGISSCYNSTLEYLVTSGARGYIGAVYPGPCTHPTTLDKTSTTTIAMPSDGVLALWGGGTIPNQALTDPAAWVAGGANRLVFFGPDHPAYQPGAPSGYLGTIRTTVTCALSSGGTTYVEAFAEVDVPQGDDLPIPPASCPPGSIAIFAAFDYRATGTTEWIGIGSSEAPDFVNDLPVSYPDCFNTVRECVVELWKVGAGGSLTSCGPIGQYCPDWAREATMNPEAYRCAYGPYGLDLANCSMYRNPGVGVLPNDSGETAPDGKPVPLPITAPVPDPLPNPVTDPLTGAPVPLPTPQAEAESRECFPSGWGVINPFSWVVMPLQCAFQPRTSVLEDSLGKLDRTWSRTAPAKIIAAVEAWEFVPPVSGCEGILVDLFFLGPPFYIMQACPGDMLADLAMWSRIFGAVVITVYGVLAITRHVGRIIGYGGLGADD